MKGPSLLQRAVRVRIGWLRAVLVTALWPAVAIGWCWDFVRNGQLPPAGVLGTMYRVALRGFQDYTRPM